MIPTQLSSPLEKIHPRHHNSVKPSFWSSKADQATVEKVVVHFNCGRATFVSKGSGEAANISSLFYPCEASRLGVEVQLSANPLQTRPGLRMGRVLLHPSRVAPREQGFPGLSDLLRRVTEGSHPLD